MEVYGVIYQIYCTANGKIYIGQARDVNERWKNHLYKLNNNKHHNPHLQNAFNLYGTSAFEWTIKCDCFSQDDMNDLEIFYIKQAGKNCFNAKMGGEGCTATEETRRKISIAMSGINNPYYGKTHSEETRKKLSDASLGKTHSEETRKKLSDAHLGKTQSAETIAKRNATLAANRKPMSDEQKKKISDARQGKSRSEESRRKQSITNYGKTHSEETRRKMSSAHRGKTQSAETIAKQKATRATNRLLKAQH